MPDALGILWVVVAGIAVLIPALIHGIFLGTFDLLSQPGLIHPAGFVPHNSIYSDQINEMIPWSTLSWTQVHSGHLPLWNAYSGEGMPLAFNWESAPFGLPALIGYLFPLRLAYTVQVIVTLVIAGTGAYAMGRVLRLGILASAMTGVVFELSGPLAGWLGYPHAAVMSWGGWLFAAALLIVRGQHRARNIVFFALVLGFALYAGQPEVLIVMGMALGLFLLVVLLARAPRRGLRPSAWSAFDMVIATSAGFALAAPVALPGLQLVAASVRSQVGPPTSSLPLHQLTYVIFQGFDGLPIKGNFPFSLFSYFYPASVAYVGLIAVVMAFLAVVLRWRRAEVVGFAAVVIITMAIVFVPHVASELSRIPAVGKVNWLRALMPFALAIAALSGVGLDALVRALDERRARKWLGFGFGGAALTLLAVWVGVRNSDLPSSSASLVLAASTSIGHAVQVPAYFLGIRDKSFVWPLVGTALGLAAAVTLTIRTRRRPGCQIPQSNRVTNGAHSENEPVGQDVIGASALSTSSDDAGIADLTPIQRGRFRINLTHWIAISLLACESGFLITAGAPLWASSSHTVTPTPAVSALQKVVGDRTVGSGCATSFFPEANILFNVHQLGIYDGDVPKGYFTTWQHLTGVPGGLKDLDLFCPVVTDATLARRFGVGFILVPTGASGPTGGVFDRRVGNVDVYRIPGAVPATLTPIPRSGQLPPPDAKGTPVKVTHPDPAAWRVTVDTSHAQVLRLRLTDVPGWHATIDGRSLRLESFSGIMLQARVPPGRHTVELHYWPTAFTVGIVLAGFSAVSLVALLVMPKYLRSWRSKPNREY
jgi:hypothetical protein